MVLYPALMEFLSMFVVDLRTRMQVERTNGALLVVVGLIATLASLSFEH